MDPDQISEAVTNPQALLGGVDWLAFGVSILAGFIVPWVCAKMVGRKLGWIAYLVVGTIASSLFYWLTQKFEAVFTHSLVMGVLVVLLIAMIGLFINSVRKP